MDTFTLNKIAGAVLGTLLIVIGSMVISRMVYEPHDATGGHGTEHAAAEGDGASHDVADDAMGAAEAESAGTESLGALIAAADAGAGKKVAKKCGACHSFEEGGANKVGPNLWDIVGRPVASGAGFGYSDAMAAIGGSWDFAMLEAFMADPKGTVPGTKMSFAGVRKPGQRADLLAYLRSLSATPAPLPE
jgi:cytochrome c